MALPKGVRIIALVTIAVMLWMFTRILGSSPSSSRRPGTGIKIDDMARDPNLDRQ